MARTLEQTLQEMIGNLMFQVAALTVANEVLQEQLATALKQPPKQD